LGDDAGVENNISDKIREMEQFNAEEKYDTKENSKK
jgi:hypothetical protein